MDSHELQIEPQANNAWYYGIWFVPGGDKDFLGKLYKQHGKWVFDYRFRYYNPAHPGAFSGKDQKNYYRAAGRDDSDGELERLLPTVLEVVAGISKRYGRPADFVDLKCCDGDPKFMFELGSRDWAHFKVSSEPPASPRPGGE